MKGERIQKITLGELIDLDMFLKRQSCGMSLVKAHGFITAVVSFPDLFMPSDWIPVLVGELKDPKDAADTNLRFDNLISLYLQITDSLNSDDDFKFLLSPEKPFMSLDAAPCSNVQEWCKGYCLALMWNDKEWLNADEEFVTQACTTFFKLTDFIKTTTIQQCSTEWQHDKKDLIKHLPRLVKMLYVYWLGEQHLGFIHHLQTLRTTACPCGSSKNYCDCCLLDAKESSLH